MCNHQHEARVAFFDKTVKGYANDEAWKNTDNNDFDDIFIKFGRPIPKKVGKQLFCSCTLVKFVDDNESELKVIASALGAKTDYSSLVSLSCYLKKQNIEAVGQKTIMRY